MPDAVELKTLRKMNFGVAMLKILMRSQIHQLLTLKVDLVVMEVLQVKLQKGLSQEEEGLQIILLERLVEDRKSVV